VRLLHKERESWHRKKAAALRETGAYSKPKMLGVKAFGGELVSAGSVIVRQRGIPVPSGKQRRYR